MTRPTLALAALVLPLLALVASPTVAAPRKPAPRDMLLSHSAGQPYGRLQSRCAGMFAAAFNYSSLRGDPEQAWQDREIGKAMLNDAIGRLVIDRGLERKPAFDLTLPEVAVGRAVAEDLFADSGFGPRSRWNIQRSICLDIRDAYRGRRG
jgi:hypothetical protein